MPRKTRVRRRYKRKRGGNIQPPGGAPIDMPDNPILDIVPPEVKPDIPRPQYKYKRPKMGLLTQIRAFLKRNHLVSRGLRTIGAKSLAERALRSGYGRRRKYRRRRRGGCQFN